MRVKRPVVFIVRVFVPALSALLVGGCAGERLAYDDAQYAAPPPARHADGDADQDDGLSDVVPAGEEDDTPVSVLTINSDAITVEDILRPIRADLESAAQNMPPAEYQRYLISRVEDRVRMVARNTLLYQEAEKDLVEQQHQIVDDYVDQRIRERVNGEFGGRQTRFESALREQGSSLAEEREQIRRDVLVMHWLRTTIHRRIADPTRDELWEVYVEQKGELAKPERRRMQIIEIAHASMLGEAAAQPGGPEPMQAKRAACEKAAALLTRLREGADFGELAKEHSTGPHAARGGDWGWVTRNGLREQWRPVLDALFALPSMQLPSEVVETEDACVIVQAADIQPAEQPDFESLQPELMERYREAQFGRLVEKEVMRLQERAQIYPRRIGRFMQAIANAAPAPSFSSASR